MTRIHRFKATYIFPALKLTSIFSAFHIGCLPFGMLLVHLFICRFHWHCSSHVTGLTSSMFLIINCLPSQHTSLKYVNTLVLRACAVFVLCSFSNASHFICSWVCTYIYTLLSWGPTTSPLSYGTCAFNTDIHSYIFLLTNFLLILTDWMEKSAAVTEPSLAAVPYLHISLLEKLSYFDWNLS